MKHFVFLLATLFAFVLASCNDDKPHHTWGTLEVAYINGKESPTKGLVYNSRLTPHEVCLLDTVKIYGSGMHCPEQGAINHAITAAVVSIASGHVDTVNNRIGYDVGNIIDANGVMNVDENMIFSDTCNWTILAPIYETLPDGIGGYFRAATSWDTVAYIPIANRVAVRDTLRQLQDDPDGNFDIIMKIFNDAFEFIPCTGEEYKELKAKGLN